MNHPRRKLRLQALALGALAIGPLPALFALSVHEPVSLAGAYFGWAIALYLFAAGGTLVAALTFEPGEPLRSGWLLLAASYLVLVPGRIRLGPSASGLAAMVERTPWVNALTSVASGALAVTGFLLLSRAWRASGLDTTSRSGRVVGLDGRTVRVVEEVFRTLGACFAFAAGMAQRWVMKERE